MEIELKKELQDVMEIQWADNVKARVLDNEMQNNFVKHRSGKRIRSQFAIYEYYKKKLED